MDKIINVISFATRGAQVVAGGYAVFKLTLYAIYHMKKNPQKVEEAREGMKNVGIGILIAISAEFIIAWLQTA